MDYTVFVALMALKPLLYKGFITDFSLQLQLLVVFCPSQKFGYSFELKLQKARLARIARIMKCVFNDINNIPTIYFAQNLVSKINPYGIFKIKPIPPTIRKHVMLWRRKKIDYELSDVKPSSSVFHILLNLAPPHLHQTPESVPSLKDWPRVKKTPFTTIN